METNKAKLDAAYSHLKNFCGVLFLLLSFTINAQTVESGKAIEVAKNFYNSSLTQQSSLKSATNTNASLVRTEYCNKFSNNLKSAGLSPAYHIINIGENEGFIIVSGDERANPILGYSMNGHFNPDNIPDQLKAFLANYNEEISLLVNEDTEYKTLPNHKWEEITSGQTKSAETSGEFYLVKTKWEQTQYYNGQCPEESKVQAPYAGHVPAGCVAVAVSQIMKYWAWPEKGTGENCYIPVSSKQYGELCVNFDTEYNWDSMPEKLTASSSNTEKEAVAKLIYHTAAAAKTDFIYYGSSASSSSAKNSLKYYFKYTAKSKLVYKNRYSEEEWINLLKTQLDNGMPMFYRGDDNGNFGHAFICDGYDNENRFHFNWGWGGSFDGFFSLNAVVPRSNYNFSFNQGAIINIFPDNEDYTVENVSLNKSFITDGENIDVNYDLIYKGYDFNETGPEFAYYLSEDDKLDSNDLILNKEYISLSSKNNKVSKNSSLALPENTKYGIYYLLIVADSKNNIEEIDETNNVAMVQFTFSEPTLNDFMVENANVSYNKNATIGNSTIQSGEILLLTCSQIYDGTANINVFQKSGYILSTDQFYDSSDILLGEGVSSLSKNKKSEEITLQVTIPDETQSGSYYILFVSDYTNEFDETDEENNISFLKVDINRCYDITEPNNSFEYAYTIGNIADYFQDNLCIQKDDEDWFSFNISSETFYIKISNIKDSLKGNYGLQVDKNGSFLNIQTFATNGNTDTKIWLYDEDFNLLAEDDDSGEGDLSKLTYKFSFDNRFTPFSENELILYPNPTRGEIFIESNLADISEEISINITDTKGRLIKQHNIEQFSFMNNSIDLSDFPSGEYIIALISNNGMKQAQRIIKY